MKQIYQWTDIQLLTKMRQVIPFLNLIPDDIYFTLDSSSFLLPQQAIITARNELEKTINGYVMTYKRNTFILTTPVSVDLCAILKGAQLNTYQIQLLNKSEEKYKTHNISFVVYQKPLQFVSYKESLLYAYYALHNLPIGGDNNTTFTTFP